MEKTSVIDTYVIRGLEVCDLSGTNAVKQPMVYTRVEMPVSMEDVPRQADVNRWSYLRGIHIPDIDSEVELLIGTNAPKASEPWQVVYSQENRPYTMKTLLGWAICHHTQYVSVNRCSVCGDKGLERQVESYFRQDFNERTLDDKPEHSREDRTFMSMVSANVEQKEGHYQIALPFRQQEVNMPNNRPQALRSTTEKKAS